MAGATTPESRTWLWRRRWLAFLATLFLTTVDAYCIWSPGPLAGTPFGFILFAVFLPGQLLVLTVFPKTAGWPSAWMAVGVLGLVNGVFWYLVGWGIVRIGLILRSMRKR